MSNAEKSIGARACEFHFQEVRVDYSVLDYYGIISLDRRLSSLPYCYRCRPSSGWLEPTTVYSVLKFKCMLPKAASLWYQKKDEEQNQKTEHRAIVGEARERRKESSVIRCYSKEEVEA
jgi:hypothetical protein